MAKLNLSYETIRTLAAPAGSGTGLTTTATTGPDHTRGATGCLVPRRPQAGHYLPELLVGLLVCSVLAISGASMWAAWQAPPSHIASELPKTP
jgi:hypothetical protein